MEKDKENVQKNPREERPDGSGKKRWERPRVESGRLFEVNTVSCLRQPGNPPCNPGPFVA